jgi:ubiquinone/menaquinone biosynthesis C-methylase UbiE
MVNNEEVYIDAVKSNFLQNRSSGNKQFAALDFDEWVGSVIDEMSFSNVLDICCGTGNQLILYSKKSKNAKIKGIDLSSDSLLIAEERLTKNKSIDRVDLIEGKMDETFSLDGIIKSKFDLISCFYGLYYANNAGVLLEQAIEHLDSDGNILIVGPYGNNNKAFFDILLRYFELPDLVYRSSSSFMEYEVLPVLEKKLKVEKKSFVNKIIYPDVSSVMNYWRSTTFFNKDFEKHVELDLIKHFELNNNFIVEKHVMAIIGNKGH